MVFIDPVTRQRIVHARHVGDIIWEAKGAASISTEKVQVVGGWQDFSGSKSVNSRAQQQFAGQQNILQGTDAHIEGGAKLGNLFSDGQNADIKRERPLLKYKRLDK